MAEERDQEFEQFKTGLLRLIGIDLNNYKERQVKRRLGTLMNDLGESTYQGFLKRLERDADAKEKFLRRVTINVSEFFRNPERYQELDQHYIPRLLAERSQPKVWSAGASTGEEPYSLAMLLLKHNPRFRGPVLGTDVDKESLAFAREALYPAGRLRYVPEDIKKRFFQNEGERYRVAPEVRQVVKLQHQDLMRDPFGSDYDLILCRNVVIYFTEEAKDKLYRRFAQALRPGGILLTGSTEQIFNPRRYGLKSLTSFFYQRQDPGDG